MITVVLFSSNMFLSKLIEFILGSSTSHSGIGFYKEGKQYVLHAAWGGVQITPMDVILSNHTIAAEFEVLTNFEDELKLAEKRVGEPYDTIGLFGYIPVLLARKFGIGINNPLASKSAVVCSEFIAQLDINNEIQEFHQLNSETITPKDLMEICSTGKSFKRII